MSTKKPFWQELVLQSIAPALALMGVTISVRPDIIGTKPECQRLVTASIDHTGDDRLPPSAAPDIQATGSTEIPPELILVDEYEFSISHVGILIATLILLVQVIRLIHNWKK